MRDVTQWKSLSSKPIYFTLGWGEFVLNIFINDVSSPDNMLSKSDNENFKHTDPELLEKNEDKLIFIYKCNTMLTLKTEYIFF